MSKTVVCADDGSGINWPVPNVKVTETGRQLRSSKPDVHYHIPSDSKGATSLSPAAKLDTKVDKKSAVKLEVEPLVSLVDEELIAEAEESQLQISFSQANITDQDTDESVQDEPVQVIDVTEMAEERTLIPSPFGGSSEEDASEFWRRLKTYIGYKNLNEEASLRLAQAMLVQTARDWLEKLPVEKKNTFQQLETAFDERYVKPKILRFCSARDIFDKKQKVDENVETYANRLQSLNKRVNVADETLLYAFMSGLRPAIASFVMGKCPQNFAQALEEARVAEFSTVDCTTKTDQHLLDQMSEMRKDLQQLAQRYDSISLSASVQGSRNDFTPERRVTFQNAEARPRSPRPQRSNWQPPSAQGINFVRPVQPQMRQYSASNLRGSRGNRGFRQATPQSRVDTDTRCNKCGRQPHSNVMYCPAVNKQCMNCGKFGHFRSVCRLLKQE